MNLGYLEVHMGYGLMVILTDVKRSEITKFSLIERVQVMLDVLST